MEDLQAQITEVMRISGELAERGLPGLTEAIQKLSDLRRFPLLPRQRMSIDHALTFLHRDQADAVLQQMKSEGLCDE